MRASRSRTPARKASPSDRLDDHREAVQNCLEKLQWWICCLGPSPDSDVIDWRHVGSMALLRVELEAIERRVLGE